MRPRFAIAALSFLLASASVQAQTTSGEGAQAGKSLTTGTTSVATP